MWTLADAGVIPSGAGRIRRHNNVYEVGTKYSGSGKRSILIRNTTHVVILLPSAVLNSKHFSFSRVSGEKWERSSKKYRLGIDCMTRAAWSTMAHPLPTNRRRKQA